MLAQQTRDCVRGAYVGAKEAQATNVSRSKARQQTKARPEYIPTGATIAAVEKLLGGSLLGEQLLARRLAIASHSIPSSNMWGKEDIDCEGTRQERVGGRFSGKREIRRKSSATAAKPKLSSLIEEREITLRVRVFHWCVCVCHHQTECRACEL